jgi:nitrate/TMAO reductase-like tetraheme cytochrome c subunit
VSERGENRAEPRGTRRGRIAGFFRFLGITCGREDGRLLVFHRRFLLTLAALIALFIAGDLGLLHYSSTPGFCAKCHAIKPYVATWEAGAHSEFSCKKCHFGIGFKDYVRRKVAGVGELVTTITADDIPRPHGEIKDAVCLRPGCHVQSELKDALRFRDKFAFGHTAHLTKLRNDKKLRCTSCHNNIENEEHFKVYEQICISCHFHARGDGRSMMPVGTCTTCHNAPADDIRLTARRTFSHKPYLERKVECWKCHFDSVDGTGEVPRRSCVRCHGLREEIEKRSDSRLVHKTHLEERKVDCFQCHAEIRHGLHVAEGKDNRNCASCHATGHDAVTKLYRGEGGRGVAPVRGAHFIANVDCVACHICPETEGGGKPLSVKTYEATAKSCRDCHAEDFKGMLEIWTRDIRDAMDGSGKALAAARQALESLPKDGEAGAQARKLLEDAEHNYRFVEAGRGVHNAAYALELLDKVKSLCSEIRKLSGQATGADAD